MIDLTVPAGAKWDELVPHADRLQRIGEHELALECLNLAIMTCPHVWVDTISARREVAAKRVRGIQTREKLSQIKLNPFRRSNTCNQNVH